MNLKPKFNRGLAVMDEVIFHPNRRGVSLQLIAKMNKETDKLEKGEMFKFLNIFIPMDTIDRFIHGEEIVAEIKEKRTKYTAG